MLTQTEQHFEQIVQRLMILGLPRQLEDSIIAVRLALKKLEFLEEPERQVRANKVKLEDC